MGEVARATDGEETRDRGSRALRVVLGEREVAAHERDAELVEQPRRKDVRVAEGRVRVQDILIGREQAAETPIARQILVLAIVDGVSERERVARPRPVIRAAQEGMVQAGVGNVHVRLANLDGHAIDNCCPEVGERRVRPEHILQKVQTLQHSLPASRGLSLPKRNPAEGRKTSLGRNVDRGRARTGRGVLRVPLVESEEKQPVAEHRAPEVEPELVPDVLRRSAQIVALFNVGP